MRQASNQILQAHAAGREWREAYDAGNMALAVAIETATLTEGFEHGTEHGARILAAFWRGASERPAPQPITMEETDDGE